MTNHRERMRASQELGSYLGTGWSFPPRFTLGGAEVAMVTGVADVHESLHILLTTRLGERVLRENFGCGLDDVLFEELNQDLINRITALINDAILYHEPRVELLAVDVTQDRDDAGLLAIRIGYRIRGVNSRFNMVYPFYLNEASAG
jgi:phage baseplate assembly protein W